MRHIIACRICGKPKVAYLPYIKTCGAKRCKLEYRHRFYRFTEERKKRASALAKERGYGLWMKGRTTSDRHKEVHRKRWTGASNPRWKGGVPRSLTHRNWLAAHPENSRHYSRIRKSIKRGARGKYRLGEWLALKRAYLFTCPACARTEPEIKLTVDHIVPISRGGSNLIENIQPLCEGCNARKWARTQRFDASLIVAKFKNTIAA
ncbi:MAG TPA: HNH endonuclease [Bryobacteraceae bacterium]